MRIAFTFSFLAAACGGSMDASHGPGGNPPGRNPPGCTTSCVDGGAPDSSKGPGQSGPVGPTGGSVNLLHFGITGDTRPAQCGTSYPYPTDVITSIASAFKAAGAQFALDLGDHMYVCVEDLTQTTAQMNLYMQSIQTFGSTWFMTMGNHECHGTPCLPGSTQANYVAYMNALAPISSLPYYSFNVTTSLGLATFVIVADNAWDSNQATWLDSTLATADANAKYTIVVRHHPSGDTTVTTNADSMAIIRSHKFALFLTGHSHLYNHPSTDSGRDIVLGTGGAPLIAGGAFWGYALIDQNADGTLNVTVFDVSNNSTVDSWSVGPN